MSKTAAALAALGAALLLAGPAQAARETTLLVRFERGTHVARVLRGLGARRERTIRPIAVQVVRVPAGRAPSVLARLRARTDVSLAEPDNVVWGDTTPQDPLWAGDWPAPTVDLPSAWDVTTGSSNVVVAVVDSGVDASQPDLAGAVLPGYDFADGDADPSDVFGHGTSVAGIIAARANNGLGSAGVCWSCRILPVRVLGADNRGTDSAIASGIIWAADHGASIINLSLGGPYADPVLEAAIQHAQSLGAVVVASAGNDGNSTPMYPGGFAEVISVGATTASDALYGFSNFGTWVKVAAPGCIATTGMTGRFVEFCGTSASAPVVSGIAALVRSRVPDASAAAIEQALETTAKPVGGIRYGRVDAFRTVSSFAAAVPKAPTLAPLVTGHARVGETLTGLPGFSGSAELSYQWERCKAGTCSAIAGATGPTYLAVTDDLGFTVRVRVSASGSFGKVDAVSPEVGPVGAAESAVLRNVSPPTVTGPAVVGAVLRGDPGTWVGTGVVFRKLQWERCSSGFSCQVVASGSRTYRVGRADRGFRLRFVAVAADASSRRVPAASALTARVS